MCECMCVCVGSVCVYVCVFVLLQLHRNTRAPPYKLISAAETPVNCRNLMS